MFYHNYAGGAGLTKGGVFNRVAGIKETERAQWLRQDGSQVQSIINWTVNGKHER
jgi:hypothetical protein